MSPDSHRLVFGLIIFIAAMIPLTRFRNRNTFSSLLIASLTVRLIVAESFAGVITVMEAASVTLLQQIGFIVPSYSISCESPRLSG